MELLEKNQLLKLNLFRQLQKEQGGVSIYEISQKLDISKDTVKKYLVFLKEDIQKYQLTVELIIENQNIVLKNQEESNVQILKSAYLADSIFVEMCFHIVREKSLTIDLLSKKIFATYATTRRNLKKINDYLTRYDLKICEKKICFIGDELNIRLFLTKLFHSIHDSHKKKCSWLRYDPFNQTVSDINNTDFIKRANQSFFCLFLQITLYRVKQGNFCKPINTIPEIIYKEEVTEFLHCFFKKRVRISQNNLFNEVKAIKNIIILLKLNEERIMESFQTKDVLIDEQSQWLIQITEQKLNNQFSLLEKNRLMDVLRIEYYRVVSIHPALLESYELPSGHPYKAPIIQLMHELVGLPTRFFKEDQQKEQAILYHYLIELFKLGKIKELLPKIQVNVHIANHDLILEKLFKDIASSFVEIEFNEDKNVSPHLILTDSYVYKETSDHPETLYLTVEDTLTCNYFKIVETVNSVMKAIFELEEWNISKTPTVPSC